MIPIGMRLWWLDDIEEGFHELNKIREFFKKNMDVIDKGLRVRKP